MNDKIGVQKEIDNMGRIVIPKEMRELLGLEKKVELIVTKEGVLLRNPQYILIKKSEDFYPFFAHTTIGGENPKLKKDDQNEKPSERAKHEQEQPR